MMMSSPTSKFSYSINMIVQTTTCIQVRLCRQHSQKGIKTATCCSSHSPASMIRRTSYMTVQVVEPYVVVSQQSSTTKEHEKASDMIASYDMIVHLYRYGLGLLHYIIPLPPKKRDARQRETGVPLWKYTPTATAPLWRC